MKNNFTTWIFWKTSFVPLILSWSTLDFVFSPNLPANNLGVENRTGFFQAYPSSPIIKIWDWIMPFLTILIPECWDKKLYLQFPLSCFVYLKHTMSYLQSQIHLFLTNPTKLNEIFCKFQFYFCFLTGLSNVLKAENWT